jgi:hypothetical protein
LYRTQFDFLKSRSTFGATAAYAAVLTIVCSAIAHSHPTEQVRPGRHSHQICENTWVQVLSIDEQEGAHHVDSYPLCGLLYYEVKIWWWGDDLRQEPWPGQLESEGLCYYV